MTTSVIQNGKRIVALPDNCTGCGLCELACSFVKFNDFDPEKAFIAVDRQPGSHGFDVVFKDDCDACGYCWSACKFDAIHLERID